MKFTSKQEQLNWLKATATEIKRMESERSQCVMHGQFDRAFSLLKGIKFARMKFYKESKIYERRRY